MASSQSSQRIAYVYKGKKAVNGTKVRVIWGRCTRTHGNSGVVRAKFSSNLPPVTFGATCRIVGCRLFALRIIFTVYFLTDALPIKHLNFNKFLCMRINGKYIWSMFRNGFGFG